MEPFSTTIFSTEGGPSVAPNPKQRQPKQKKPQPQPQPRDKPHTTKRQPLDLSHFTLNERIEREEEQEELNKLKNENKNNKKQQNNKNNNKNNNSNSNYKNTSNKNRKSKLPPEPTEILPFLYLGSAINAADAALANALRLSCILNVAEELHAQPAETQKDYKHYTQLWTAQVETQSTQGTQTAQEAQTTQETHATQTTQSGAVESQCERVSIIVHDAVPAGNNQYDTFEQAFAVIDKAKESGRPVLVHCMRGRSRSATIVIGYLMTRNSWTLTQAYAHVKKLRPFIGPHRRLKKQLVEFDFHVHGKHSIEPEANW